MLTLLFQLNKLIISLGGGFLSLCYQKIINNNWEWNDPMVKKEKKSLENLSLIIKKEFMNHSQINRDKILSKQASKYLKYYESAKNIQNLGSGDFIDY
jgi:hypothetical protein